MLTFTRIDHFAQVVPAIEPQAHFLESLLGFQREREWEDAREGARALVMAIPGRGGVRWEVREPLDDTSPLHQFLGSARGPGVHHVALEVPDLAKASEELAELRVPASHSGQRLELTPEEGGQGFRFLLYAPDAERLTRPPGEPLGDRNAGTLGIVGIDHLCHACPDRDELGRWYHEVFGMKETHRTPPGEHEDLADLVMDVPGKQMRWEVLQPVGEESFVTRFLERRGPGIHHMAFQVADWERAIAACDQHEIPYFDENSGTTDGAAWHDAFIHPKFTGGLLLQFFWEERPDAWVASDKVRSDA